MVNGAGAVFGSPLAAGVIEVFGVGSFFPVIAGLQCLIVAVVLFRMTRRAAVPNEAQGTFVAIPETSSAVVATLNPETEWVPGADEIEEEDDPFYDNPYVMRSEP